MSDTIYLNVVGAFFVGLVVASAFYGVATQQTFYYLMSYPKDRLSVKIMVVNVWILDTFQIATVYHGVYFYLFKNYAHPEMLSRIPWSLVASKGLNTVITVIVQIFFVLRIFYLAQGKLRKYLCGAIMVPIVGHLGAGIATVVLTAKIDNVIHLREETIQGVLPLGILDVASDIAIMVALCKLLHENRSPFKRTNALITHLIIFTITRGIFTSAVATAELAVFLLTPRTLWFMSIEFGIGKLYFLSMLVTLNCRKGLHRQYLNEDSLNFLQRSTILRFGDAEAQKSSTPSSLIIGGESTGTQTTSDEAN